MADKTAALGTGTLTIQSGEETLTIEVSAGGNSWKASATLSTPRRAGSPRRSSTTAAARPGAWR
ncbi:hypothetical protein ACFSHR_01900 [Azotobacter chroococcum]